MAFPLFISLFLMLRILGSPSQSPQSDVSAFQIDIHKAQNVLWNEFGDEPVEPPSQLPTFEIRPIFNDWGPPTNRVDLVFFSDGYLPQEKQKFFDDASRLAKEVSESQAFNTVQPLLNFWAAFSPSEESGIGIWEPKRTPFGLFRNGTELRGVFCAYYEVGQAVCDLLKEQCDYPIILGNDPLYGGEQERCYAYTVWFADWADPGLRIGNLTTITASNLTGALILGHELGHSMMGVGEEYDGSGNYHGPNAVFDPQNLSWGHWISDSSRMNPFGDPRIERSVLVLQEYPWAFLNTTIQWSTDFESWGHYERFSVQFSLAGIPEKGDLRVSLDGLILDWEPKKSIGMDRWFYNVFFSRRLPPGRHQLNFTLLDKKNEGSARLCSIEILEYGSEDEFVLAPGYYSLYPTFSSSNKTSFRPTNDDCLMRRLTALTFCKVCLETLWIQLLDDVNLIDNIHGTCLPSRTDPSSWTRALSIDLLPLAHLRETPVVPKESYSILWQKNGVVIADFSNKTVIEIDDEESIGRYTVTVRFSTEEVRLDVPWLERHINYNITEMC